MTLTPLYYLDKDGDKHGPVTPLAMLDLWRRGIVSDDTLTAMEGDDDWLPLEMFEDVVKPTKKTHRVAEVTPSRRRASGLSWLATLGGILTIGGGVVLFFHLLLGGILAGLGLLMIMAFRAP